MSGGFCACPPYVTSRECILVRYGSNQYDETCECACHESGDEDDAGYALPGEFDDDDQDHDFTEEELVQ